jgi:hypothetical protein
MPRRLFPALLLLLFLGLAGGLLSIPYLVRDRSLLVSTAAPLTFADEIEGIEVDGRLDLAPGGTFTVAVRLAGRHGVTGDLPGPGLALTMPEHAMAPLVPALEARGNGLFEASGTLPMPGRWELRLDLPQGSTVLAFQFSG